MLVNSKLKNGSLRREIRHPDLKTTDLPWIAPTFPTNMPGNEKFHFAFFVFFTRWCGVWACGLSGFRK